MKFHVVTEYPKDLDALVVRVADKEPALDTKELDRQLGGIIKREAKRRGFKGEHGQTLVLATGNPVIPHVIVLGVGKPPWQVDGYRQGIAAVMNAARAHKLYRLGTTHINRSDKKYKVAELQALAEGAALADYRYDKYRKTEEDYPEINYHVRNPIKSDHAFFKNAFSRGQQAADAAILARNLINEPPSSMTPSALAKAAVAAGKKHGFKVSVHDKAWAEKNGLNAFLAVARGSHEAPKLIRMQYAPTGAKKHIVIVGKGITFDTGGINLKPSRGGSLEDMKMDMAGGAAVIGAMSALKALGVKHRVTGYVAATDNPVGSAAYRPGDVIRAHNGKTIEVMNTDAEGRLTLADVLSYAEKNDKPNVIIDLATLTATEVSLGLHYAAIFGDEKVSQPMQEAGEISGEKVWPFPLPEEYQETVKGRIADLRNTGTDRGYSINGAVFLRNFVTEKTPWVHIDIGSPASSEKDRGYLKTGATGFGVRLLLEYFGK